MTRSGDCWIDGEKAGYRWQSARRASTQRVAERLTSGRDAARRRSFSTKGDDMPDDQRSADGKPMVTVTGAGRVTVNAEVVSYRRGLANSGLGRAANSFDCPPTRRPDGNRVCAHRGNRSAEPWAPSVESPESSQPPGTPGPSQPAINQPQQPAAAPNLQFSLPFIVQQSHSGPLPAPEQLAAYERVPFPRGGVDIRRGKAECRTR